MNSPWISVKEKLPDHFVNIFFFDKYKKRHYAGWYDNDGFCTAMGGVQVNITHWMLVPILSDNE